MTHPTSGTAVNPANTPKEVSIPTIPAEQPTIEPNVAQNPLIPDLICREWLAERGGGLYLVC